MRATDSNELANQIETILKAAFVDMDARKTVEECICHLRTQHQLMEANLEIVRLKENYHAEA